MAYLIDTHAHLDSPIYEGDLDIVVRHAADDDIYAVTVGNDYRTSRRAVEIAEKYPSVYAAVGMHPMHIRGDADAEDKLVDVQAFQELAGHPKVVAIGECGLDYHDFAHGYRKGPGAREVEKIKSRQKKVLGSFLQLAREFRLPLLLHCRDAHKDMLFMLETWDKASPGFDSRGVVHAYSGTWKDARRYFNLEFMISITGLITHGAYQTEVVKKSPLNRIVLESDCPYATPIPWNIRRNEPAYLTVVADTVAGIRGATKDAVAAQTTMNCRNIFRKMRI